MVSGPVTLCYCFIEVIKSKMKIEVLLYEYLTARFSPTLRPPAYKQYYIRHDGNRRGEKIYYVLCGVCL